MKSKSYLFFFVSKGSAGVAFADSGLAAKNAANSRASVLRAYSAPALKYDVKHVIDVICDNKHTCNVRIAPRHTIMIVLPADKTRIASMRSARVSTSTMGSTIVLNAGMVTVGLGNKLRGKVSPCKYALTCNVDSQTKYIYDYRANQYISTSLSDLNTPKLDPSKNIALSSHLCILRSKPDMPTAIRACSNACRITVSLTRELS